MRVKFCGKSRPGTSPRRWGSWRVRRCGWPHSSTTWRGSTRSTSSPRSTPGAAASSRTPRIRAPPTASWPGTSRRPCPPSVKKAGNFGAMSGRPSAIAHLIRPSPRRLSLTTTCRGPSSSPRRRGRSFPPWCPSFLSGKPRSRRCSACICAGRAPCRGAWFRDWMLLMGQRVRCCREAVVPQQQHQSHSLATSAPHFAQRPSMSTQSWRMRSV